MDIPWILKNRILKPYNHERQFELNIQQLLLQLQGDVFWDVGANVGLYSLLLRKNFRHVFAVEPNPVVRRRLKARLLWHFARNVSVLPFALSDQNGETWLSPGDDRFRAWSKLHESGINGKTATFDSIYQRSVDLMKIDVEGAEFLVLQGARDALQEGRIMNLLIEVHSWDREKELEEILTKYGYRCEWMRTQELHVFAKRVDLPSRPPDSAATSS